MDKALRKVMSYRLLAIGLLIFLFFTIDYRLSAIDHVYAQPEQHIRVLVLKDAQSLSLKVRGSYEILDSGDKSVLSRGKNLKTTITIYQNNIMLGKMNFKGRGLLIRPIDPQALAVNGRNFRGDIELLKSNNKQISAINHIELEDYIKGILYNEASHYWPKAALEAQAIISRTYAIYQIGENSSKDYDVTSDIYSQVYGGKASERYRTNKAVDETGGLMLAYQGKVFPAYYHATCGGHTEDASILWNISLAPLKGVPCSFCKDSVHYNWHAVLTQDEIRDALSKEKYKIKNIKDILLLGRDNSNRVRSLKIISDTKDIELAAKDFRQILGPNSIKSANFKLNVVNHDVVFEGLGWGHGVGLCQWGAYFMAKQGYSVKEILKYYYPGSDVETFRF